MLEATFQTRVPFLGQIREPGEVVGGEDLANVSRTVLDALVAQKHILLNDGSAPGPHDPEAVAALQAGVDRLRDMITTMGKDHAEAIAALREALPGAVKIVVQQEIAQAAASTTETVQAAVAATVTPRQPQRRA